MKTMLTEKQINALKEKGAHVGQRVNDSRLFIEECTIGLEFVWGKRTGEKTDYTINGKSVSDNLGDGVSRLIWNGVYIDIETGEWGLGKWASNYYLDDVQDVVAEILADEEEIERLAAAREEKLARATTEYRITAERLPYGEYNGQEAKLVDTRGEEVSAEEFLNELPGAGYSLNLQFCHNIIYMSNDWNLGTRLQSEDRVHRIGQTETVSILDLCCDDSIDKAMLRCIARKEGMLSSVKANIDNKKWLKDVIFGRREQEGENLDDEDIHEQNSSRSDKGAA